VIAADALLMGLYDALHSCDGVHHLGGSNFVLLGEKGQGADL
jgi:hypothetical protein